VSSISIYFALYLSLQIALVTPDCLVTVMRLFFRFL